MDNLDNLLTRRKTGQDVLTNSLFRNCGNKSLNNLKVDIRFKKGGAYFTHCLRNIVFRQLAMAAQLFKYTVKAIC